MFDDGVGPAATDRQSTDHSALERELAWDHGSVFFKAKQDAKLRCENRFRRGEFAIGFAFQGFDSDMDWFIDGKHLLAKGRSSQKICRDMVVLPVGCEFHGISLGVGECLWLFFDSEFADSHSGGSGFTEHPLVTSSWSQDKLAWMLTSAIKDECRGGFARGSMCVESFALSLLSRLTQKFAGVRPRAAPVPALGARDVRMLTEFIDANLRRNIALSELAQLVDLSPSHLCRAFRQATGRPPHQFQIERRIERAKALLQRPDLSLVEVAMELGFSTQSHLSNQFRRIVGMTPGRFRLEYSTHQLKSPVQISAARPSRDGEDTLHDLAGTP